MLCFAQKAGKEARFHMWVPVLSDSTYEMKGALCLGRHTRHDKLVFLPSSIRAVQSLLLLRVTETVYTVYFLPSIFAWTSGQCVFK
jgi:hypothetical protein